VSALAAPAGVARDVLDVLVTALAHGTVLAIVGALLAATLLRRARPAVLAAMWTVVLLKFIVPFGPGARFSLASLAARAHAPAPSALIVVVDPAAVARPAAPAAPATPSPLSLALIAAWLGLAAVVAGRQLARHRRARAHARAAVLAPAALAAEVDALAARIGVGRRARARLEVRIADDDVAPYLLGTLAPIVVVPAGLLAPHRRAVREAALIHELAHVRRGDAALRVVQSVAASLFFFWPVVRWVNRRIDHARELACDAYAIAHGPLAAPAYARMLVDVVRARGAAPAAGLALARRAQLGRRVDRLIERPVAAGVGAPGVLAIGAWAAVALTGAGDARAAAPRPTVCLFSPEIATAILHAHPTADVDGDGALSRNEACEFQQALRRRAVDDVLAGRAAAYAASYDLDGDGALGLAEERARRDDLASVLPVSLLSERTPLASDQLCCDCAPPGDPGVSTASATAPAAFEPVPAISTCVRGVEP
jgi:beta-lactamase regulating signal transducer with metallopeptidase domain